MLGPFVFQVEREYVEQIAKLNKKRVKFATLFGLIVFSSFQIVDLANQWTSKWNSKAMLVVFLQRCSVVLTVVSLVFTPVNYLEMVICGTLSLL